MQWCMFDSYAITAVLHKRIRGTNLVQVLLVVLDINTILDKACAGFNISFMFNKYRYRLIANQSTHIYLIRTTQIELFALLNAI